VVEAELALVTQVHDLAGVGGRKLLDVAVDRLDVEAVEQHLEGRTERQAPPTARADVVDAAKLGIDLRRIPERRRVDVERHSLGVVA